MKCTIKHILVREVYTTPTYELQLRLKPIESWNMHILTYEEEKKIIFVTLQLRTRSLFASNITLPVCRLPKHKSQNITDSHDINIVEDESGACMPVKYGYLLRVRSRGLIWFLGKKAEEQKREFNF